MNDHFFLGYEGNSALYSNSGRTGTTLSDVPVLGGNAVRRSRRLTKPSRPFSAVFDEVLDDAIHERAAKRHKSGGKEEKPGSSTRRSSSDDDVDPSEIVSNACYFAAQLRTAQVRIAC